jgi:amylosucrase
MYQPNLHQHLIKKLHEAGIVQNGQDVDFAMRFSANISMIHELYSKMYGHRADAESWYNRILTTIINAFKERSEILRKLDLQKLDKGIWFLSNEVVGMSFYVDRFCGSIKNLEEKLDYFDELGINFLHLMPIMESPEDESDGGYAVSDFRNVDKKFGTIADLRSLDDKMKEKGMFLMLDIVLNHTSSQHEWALKASEGDQKYQNYFYMYDDRSVPDAFESSMPDIFPDSSPGSFTFDKKSGKWVMTVFNHYQWDLNYTNPAVFVEMLDTIFFYANLGVDILRIDAPAFIYKAIGTTCQNLPEAHILLQLIVAIHDCARDETAHARRCREDAPRVLLERLEIDARFVVESFCMAERGELAEVLVSLVIHREQ